MRAMGVDLGTRRIGLAVSDPSGTLARPWQTLPAAATPEACAETVAAALEAFAEEASRAENGEADAGAGAGHFDVMVVGFPQRLGGGATHLTEHVRAFATALAARTGLVVHLQDERLSSHEAEARLKVLERDWRKRKAKLDAAAAAVILQDFLDACAARASVAGC
jgi:putative Holliday junction resolvase